MVKKTEIIFDLWRMGLLRKLNTVHIIFIVPIILRNSLADPRMNIAGCFCNTTSAVSGAILGLNFVSAMDNLSSLTNQNGFGTTVVGEDPNAVYGLAQCFKDLNSVDCSLCFSKIRSQLPTCYPETGGRIFLDGCFGRYENFSFFNQATDSMDSKVCSFEKNSSQPEIFGKAVEKVVTNVSLQAQRNHGFAVGSASVSNSTVYALVQCWENLNKSLCNSCINAAASSIFSCTPATEGRMLNAGCYMKYSTEIFWNLNQTVSHSSGKHKKLGIILGLSLGGLVFLLAFGIVIWRTVGLNKLNGRSVRDLYESELSASIARSKLNFRYKELKKATKNFDSSNKLGQGSHGTVFKGILSDGREVAIKRLFLNTRQWTNQFFNEVNLINQVHHKNLVKFLGCSVDGPECLLVYEYYFNKSLDQFIFDAGRAKHLDWQERLHIIQGVAEGISYLHEESEIQIIHRDIKASNILLDEKFRPKITDFGLARSFAEDQTHLSTGIAGTLGYMAPEYVVHGLLTEKVDVYSFGVLILEVVTGERCSGLGTQAGPFFLAKIWNHYKANAMEGLIDPSIYNESVKDEILHVVCVGLQCTQATPKHRPKMSNVVALLRSCKRSQQHILPFDPPPFLDVLAIESFEEGNCSSVSDIYQR